MNRINYVTAAVVCSGPSPGFSSRGEKSRRRGQKAEGGGTFLKHSIGCMQQPVDQTWNRGAPISNGGGGHHCPPPAGDEPKYVASRGGNVTVILYCVGIHFFRLFHAMNCICWFLPNAIVSI